MPDDTFDVIVVGGGPNGLTCAAYLARAGARIVVLDKRFEWGGTMMTDDYSTPFSYNPAQYALPLGRELPPYADLELERIAVRLVEPDPVAAFVPAGGGEPLVVGRDLAALGALAGLLDAADRAVTPLLYVPPMPVEEVERALDRDETRGALELARMTPAQAAALPGDERAAALVRYLCAEAGFDAADEPLGLLGAFALARLLRPAIAIGGAKALANGLFRAGARAGAQYRTVADVQRIEPRGSGGNGAGRCASPVAMGGRSRPSRSCARWTRARPSSSCSTRRSCRASCARPPSAGGPTPAGASPRTSGSRAHPRAWPARTPARR